MTKHVCKNGSYLQFSIDPLTHLRLRYSALCTQHLTGIEVSHSAIVRAAIGLYVKHLEEMLDIDPTAPQRSLFEFTTKAAIEGERGIPKNLLDNLSDTPFPKLSSLLKKNLGGPEKIREELQKTWFYQRALKAPSR